MVEAYLKVLETGYFEVQFAFEGLADENVWKRAAPGLLSIGELAGHIAYAEAMRLAGDPESHEHCPAHSPLIEPRFRYPPVTLRSSPTEEQRAMTAEQVYRELVRIHEVAVADFRSRDPDLDTCVTPDEPEYTYAHALQYVAFHIAYHTGQMYTVRHLLGDATPDN